MKGSPRHLLSWSFLKRSWSFLLWQNLFWYCGNKNSVTLFLPPAEPSTECQEYPDPDKAGCKAKMLRRLSARWTLTWLAPPRGVEGHRQSGSGRRVARRAFALGTLARHWRRCSLARRTGRMRNRQPWGPGRGPARGRWAPAPVFGFPRWAAPRCRKDRHSRGGHSPWTRPRRAWSTGSSNLCPARPACRFSLPFCRQHQRPCGTWCIETAVPSRLRNPALARTSRPAAASSPLCTARFSPLWTQEPGRPWEPNHRRRQHGRPAFLGRVWSGSAFPPRSPKCLPLHWTGLQGDHTGNTDRVQAQARTDCTLFSAQHTPERPRGAGPASHTGVSSHGDDPGRWTVAGSAVKHLKAESRPGGVSRLPPGPH